ncbi:MAG TPA: DUF4384 domain-containing protein [Longimicrobiales bacterium]|nr:DUF4384 domain-containing protein [Longimicrobiales bacterium]
MKTWPWLGTLLLLALGAAGVSAQDATAGELPEARIWLDRGDQPLLQRGDRVRVYYRTAGDAYVAIFHIDTDGTVQLLHPRAPEDDHFAQAGRDYRLLFPQSSYWFVDEYPGKGYFFLVASPEPFDFSAFDYEPYERGWNLTSVGRTVYEDPYLAMDEYVARLIPDWETAPYALDFIAYDVGEEHDYPRFLCYDCHGYRSYAAWNPYSYACTSFRVVIWDDPYFYPTYRYRGDRVVFAQARPGVARFEFKERGAGEAWSPLTRTRQPPLRRSTEYLEPTGASPVREWVPPRRPTVAPPDADRRATSPQTPSTGNRPSTPLRRTDPNQGSRVLTPGTGTPTPTGRVAPPRTDPNRGQAVPTAPKTGSDRPVLRRRPSAPPTTTRPGGGSVRPPSGRSGASRPSSGGGRAVLPSRPNSGGRPSGTLSPRSSPRGSSARPSVRPAPSRPSARPPARPSGGGKPAKPPPRRKPGGGG